MKSLPTVILLLLAAATIASAQEIKVSGQIRERSELDTKARTPHQSTDAFHLLRSRLRADAKVNDNVSAVFEAQDSRTFGQDSSNLYYSSNPPLFTLRQGYIDVKKIGSLPIGFRLGRQVLAYGNERLLGAVEWSNYGQSFDAGVLKADLGDVTVDLIGAAIKRNINPSNSYNRDVFLVGTWIAWKPKEAKSTLQAFYLYDNPKSGMFWENRHTAGLYASGEYHDFDFELDGAYQFGNEMIANSSSTDQKIGAYMVGVRAGYTMKEHSNFRAGVGLDSLSGQDPSAQKFTAFNTLYGTNHKFYGFIDYFTNIPLHTSLLGLMDIMAQVSAAPAAGFKCAADFHIFNSAIDPKDRHALSPRSTPSNRIDAVNNIGMELDLTLMYKLAEAINLTFGYSIFDWNRDSELFKGRKTNNWAYLMTAVNF